MKFSRIILALLVLAFIGACVLAKPTKEEREAKKAAKKAQREAKKAAKKAQREAKKAQRQAKKLTKQEEEEKKRQDLRNELASVQTQEFLIHHLHQIDGFILNNLNSSQELSDHDVFIGEELEGSNRQRRDTSAQTKMHGGLIRHERAVHRHGSYLKIHLVSFHNPNGERKKRATYNTTTETWPNRIPYKFDPSYPVDLIPKVKRIMNEIMDNLCVEYVEEPDFDPLDNTYETNAYLKFIGVDGNICGTVLGQGYKKSGPRNIKTCTQYYSIIHEIMHTLGVIHEQQAPNKDQYLTLNTNNILSGYWGGTYRQHNYPGKLVVSAFDSTSIMMYSRASFSSNGFDIMYPFNEEQFQLNYGRRVHLSSNYEELNQVYKCKERKCPGVSDNCGIGYLAFVKGSCKCVCPDGFDSETFCQELEDENSGPTEWPDVPFTLYAQNVNDCPVGFAKVRLDIKGTRNPMFFEDKFFSTGYWTNYYMCTRQHSGPSANFDKLPMGTYCIVKPKDEVCNGAFKEGGYYVQSTSAITYTDTAHLPDWPVLDGDGYIQMKYCCRFDREWYYPIEFPRSVPFRLISDNGQCPVVKGMRKKLGRIAMFNSNPTRYGDYPLNWYRSYYTIHNFCSYTSPEHDCGQKLTLDGNNPSVTISTPGFDIQQRAANKRCLFNFNGPEGSRIKITFNTTEMASTDALHVRRFSKWSLPYMDFQKTSIEQFLSDENFVFLEYISGENESPGTRGIKFTAEVVLPEARCYDGADNGQKYHGQKAVSEEFEECIPWADAVHCLDFPFDSAEAIDIVSEKNFCRNPGGHMKRPWCYVSVDRGNCRRSYCDVCNNLKENDDRADCAALIAADSQFCDRALQRFQCAAACDLTLNVAAPVNQISCGTPTVPADGTPTQPLKSAYVVGEMVHYYCNLHGNTEAPVAMECRANGWPELLSACSECPPGWVPYNDRCFLFKPDYYLIDDAIAECTSVGAKMFTFRNAFDVATIRNFKQMSSVPGAYGSNWINIASDATNAWYVYGENNVPAPYVDWASNAVLDDNIYHGCAVMIYENDATGNAGKFLTTDCNLAGSRIFCEIPKSESVCANKWTTCADALKEDPHFCTRSESYPIASQYCQLSCGLCYTTETHVNCTEYDMSSASYHRTSVNAEITGGDVMTFACNSGLHHVGGDLEQVCSQGVLMGDEPICSASPNIVDVGVSGVIQRGDIMATNKAFLLEDDYFMIPYNGSITHWHYYAEKTGTLYFLVYRLNVETQVMDLINHNVVPVTNINTRWTYPVPAGQEIDVQEGDVFAVFTANAEIVATVCDRDAIKLTTVRMEAVTSVDTLLANTATFSESACIFPSVGFRMAP